jgi:hypothetical protein
MRSRLLPAVVLALGSAAVGFGGCGPELESISELSHVRIVAVRKSAPYARPGETVRLQMLWEDVSDAPPRPAQPFFAFWCVNPPGGIFGECLAQVPVVPPAFSVGENTIEITVPLDAARPSPMAPNAPDTGSLYVFYGVCAGTLEVAGYPIGPDGDIGGLGGLAGLGGTDGLAGSGAVSDAISDILRELAEEGQAGEVFLPRCVDDAGEPLGSDDFVVGYSTVLVFDELRNAQPTIQGFEVAGTSVHVDCADESCTEPFDVPELSDCVPGVACFETCELEGAEGCPEVELHPIIPESVVEEDEYARIAFGEDLTESIWVSYFTDRGRLSADLRLVNDPTTGFNAAYSSTFLAPKEPGPVRIWAAVRDNRGGVSYVRIPGYVRAPSATTP